METEMTAPMPKPRGALSTDLFQALVLGEPVDPGVEPEDVEDAQVALWALYELHYRGIAGVDPALEWDPGLLALRRRLEEPFEERLWRRLREHLAGLRTGSGGGEDGGLPGVAELIRGHEGPSIARFVQRRADREQVLELLRHRSLYHLKEADPTSWVVPRLGTRVKAALMEVQFDEYGDGDPNRLHHHLFLRGLAATGLSTAYAAYVDEAPVEVLEMNNAMSLFGLHRRLRGAALGHLAAFEATSSLPSRQLAQGLRRLELPEEMAAYYDEHVEADAVHEQLALREICGALLEEEPGEHEAVLLGAFTCLDLESSYARGILGRWEAAA